MNQLCSILGITLLLAAVVNCQQTNGVVTFGTAANTDVLCYSHKIFKGQASPAYVNYYYSVVTAAANTPKPISNIKVDATNDTPFVGGVTAQIIKGGVGTPAVTLKISDGSGASFFTQSVDITMLCVP